ncbi:MAG TPA: tetratricopeptide repeat protein [Caulobacteraceae bacterium]|nr:tetratricopeptide repeat protein [Caulobacteraceae bacterium]
MRRWLVSAVIMAACLVGQHAAAGQTPPPATTAAPWDRDQAVVDAAQRDLDSGGIAALGPHLDDLWRVVRDAPQPFDKVQERDGKIVYLADDMADFLTYAAGRIAALKAAGKTGADTDVVMEPDPYPVASLFIGSYLNEVGRSEEAVAALDTGLGFEPANPLLISEKGAAYLALHQWDAALATYSGGVSAEGLRASDRARLLRGKGEALIELKRYDEAVAAYQVSLQLEPGNAIALNELAYIASVRAGATPTTPVIIAPAEKKTP